MTGGRLARLARGPRRVFTRSVPDPTGFALDCQLDEGLPAGADYMALRREASVLAAEGAPLVGMGLLAGSRLFVEAGPGAAVAVEEMGRVR